MFWTAWDGPRDNWREPPHHSRDKAASPLAVPGPSPPAAPASFVSGSYDWVSRLHVSETSTEAPGVKGTE